MSQKRADYYAAFKNKKATFTSVILFEQSNHPFRLLEITPSGTMTINIDGKGSSGYGDHEIDISMDFSLMTSWQRAFGNTFGFPQPPLAANEFRPMMFRSRPWEVAGFGVGSSSRTTVGNYELRDYNETSPGVFVLSQTYTGDIRAKFVPAIANGGDSTSGGKSDPSADHHDVSFPVDFTFDTTSSFTLDSEIFQAISTGTYAIDDVLLQRLPWDDAWASATTELSDAFDAAIATKNALADATWSGSCSASYDFGY